MGLLVHFSFHSEPLNGCCCVYEGDRGGCIIRKEDNITLGHVEQVSLTLIVAQEGSLALCKTFLLTLLFIPLAVSNRLNPIQINFYWCLRMAICAECRTFRASVLLFLLHSSEHFYA